MKKYNLYIFGIAVLFVYIFTAINSNGYHHPDEHYQIIEFAGLKAGWNEPAELTWEYDTRIRPVMQPILVFFLFKTFNIFHLDNPYTLTLLLRLITAFFSIFCICIFIKYFRKTIHKEYYTSYLILSFFLWFLPFINVRFSSETWAGLFFMLSTALLNFPEKKSKYYYISIGILLGLSFEFRFQMGLCIAGLMMWLLFIRKIQFSETIYMIAGGLFIFIMGLFLDSWFYGELVCTPYNYFMQNISNNMAAYFGVSPWYEYIKIILTRSTLIIGILILASLIFLFIKSPRNILTWCILPFLVVHSFIGHKELRFLFPLANFIPVIIIWFFQWIDLEFKKNYLKTIRKAVLIAVLLINTMGLVIIMFKPAGRGNINMAKYIEKKYPQKTTMYNISGINPYTIGTAKGLTARFYKNDNIRSIQWFILPNASIYDRRRGLIEPHDNDIIVLPKCCKEEREYVESKGYTIEFQSIPEWIEKINIYYKVYYSDFTLLLYSKSK